MERVKVTAIIAAAGKGSRSGQNQNKIFSLVGGVPVIRKTVLAFDKIKRIDEILIVHADGEKDAISKLLTDVTKPIKFVLGGATRFNSISNALSVIDDGGAVLIHDAARPDVSEKDINACVKTLLVKGSAVLAKPPVDTILETDGKDVILASKRTDKLIALTPQCFMANDIKRAYAHACANDGFTDDAGVYCAFIGKCNAVITENATKKLTFKEDFEPQNITRVGTGFDLHKLVGNRKLILGGVEIESEKGLLGHSDADVLTHAVMDALLSSASLQDIGYHFSDKKAEFKDISSMVLLERVMKMLSDKGIKPTFVSAVVMAEKPKLSPYREKIVASLATALNLPVDKVGVTFTTLEGIGTVGREEGIASQAYVLCKEI